MSRHQLCGASVRAGRQVAANYFAERRDVWLYAVNRLRPPKRDAEAGHDLVEDQQRAALVADLPQTLQESLRRRDTAHVAGDRLDDDGGDVVAMLVHRVRDGIEMGIGNADRELRDIFRPAGRIGNGEPRAAPSGFPESRA